MSETAAHILAQFDALPPQEQQDLLAEMLRRSGEWPLSPLTDEDLAAGRWATHGPRK